MKHNSLSDSFWQENQKSIQKWMDAKNISNAPLYCSVDIRSSAFKTAHVDANLFPAGFNNVHIARKDNVHNAFSEYLEDNFSDAHKILLVVEDFTRNERYIENINMLREFLESDTRECRVISIKNTEAINRDGLLQLSNWQPQLIVLNSDLSSGVPELLKGIKQPIIPAMQSGWHMRSKYSHFKAFQSVINDFANNFNLDAWALSTYFDKCENIDFKQRQGLECLAEVVEGVLSQIRAKYQQYSIKQEPYVFIKADNGTFGAGIMTARSGEEVMNINKKKRHNMHIINHGQINTRVLVQEGVPTILIAEDSVAEYTYYLVGMKAQFRILRQNLLKDELSNLNSKGMQLVAQEELPYGAGLILSQLATLATTLE